MITNAVCTVVRASDEGNVLVWQGDCMWQEVKGSETKKYGEERADNAVIFIPDITADISEKDMIIRGEYDDHDYVVRHGLTVMSAARNNYGSPGMQHIEVGAR